MASKQESVSDWMQLAKAYDKAEKEQGVKPYVIVSLRNKRTGEELHKYDIPREMLYDKSWVIDWREARLLCQNPKDGITRTTAFYDRKTGLSYGFGSLISSLTAAKANITRVKTKLKLYLEQQGNNMFFVEDEDVLARKFKAKISEYEAKVAEYEEQIKAKVQETQDRKL